MNMRVNRQEIISSSPSLFNMNKIKGISLRKRTHHNHNDDVNDMIQICNNNIDLNDVIDRINVMKRLEETSYVAQGFFNKWEEHNQRVITNNNHQPIPSIIIKGDGCYVSEARSNINNDALNEFYRSFMCKWSYQLIDYLQVDREVVAVAFSYVDRLLETHYYCAKKVFRLAIVTSIYLANNLLTSTDLPLEKVTNLCRNEFTTKMIVQMKMIILQTFNYNLHPPTSKSFIEHLCAFLPSEDVSMSTKQHIIQQSYFLVELSIYDYYFVDQNPSIIAFAAIVNVIQDLSIDTFAEIPRYTFIHHMSHILNIHSHSVCITMIQQRLDDLYKKSKQYAVDTTNKISSLKKHNDHQQGLISSTNKDLCVRRCSSEIELNSIVNNNASVGLRY